MLTDKQTWKMFIMGVKGSKYHILRGYHAFRRSVASNGEALPPSFPPQQRDAVTRAYATQSVGHPAVS